MTKSLLSLFEGRGHLKGLQQEFTEDEVGKLLITMTRGSDEDEKNLREHLATQDMEKVIDMVLVASRFCHRHYIAWLKTLPPDQLSEGSKGLIC